MRTGLGRSAVVAFLTGFVVAAGLILGVARCGPDDDGTAFRITRVEPQPDRVLDESHRLVADATRIAVLRVASVHAYGQIQAFAEFLDGLPRPEPVRVAEPRPAPQGDQGGSGSGSGRCGGDLPPCYVMMRESRGDIRAENPISTASGKWQFLDSTWRNLDAAAGYAHASDAPEWVQDAAAVELWAGGAGCSNWSAC